MAGIFEISTFYGNIVFPLSRVLTRVIQQLVFLFQKFKPTSTTAVSGAAKRRAECTSLGPGPKHPEPPLANFSLAAIRRAEAFHAVFFATKHHDD